MNIAMLITEIHILHFRFNLIIIFVILTDQFMISPIQMDIISITTIVDPEAVLLKPLHMNHLDQGSKHNITYKQVR